jgi:hypothetical protein
MTYVERARSRALIGGSIPTTPPHYQHQLVVALDALGTIARMQGKPTDSRNSGQCSYSNVIIVQPDIKFVQTLGHISTCPAGSWHSMVVER